MTYPRPFTISLTNPGAFNATQTPTQLLDIQLWGERGACATARCHRSPAPPAAAHGLTPPAPSSPTPPQSPPAECSEEGAAAAPPR